MSSDDIARRFAELNAKRAAASPPPPVKLCIGCGKPLPGVTCWKDREGPYCYECWEAK